MSICWFLGKNLSIFVPPVQKNLHNPYCHIGQLPSTVQVKSLSLTSSKRVSNSLDNLRPSDLRTLRRTSSSAARSTKWASASNSPYYISQVLENFNEPSTYAFYADYADQAVKAVLKISTILWMYLSFEVGFSSYFHGQKIQFCTI